MFNNPHYKYRRDVNEKTNESESNFLSQIHVEDGRVARAKEQNEISEVHKELRECKIRGMLEQKRRQQLRANSHELRQLETQLQSALVFKQLMEQQKVLALRKEEEMRRKFEENEKFAVECEVIRKSMLLREEEEKKKKESFRVILKCQIEDRQQRRRIEFENVVKDHEEVEKIKKRVQAEENSKIKEAKLLREKCREQMELSYQNREKQRQLERKKRICDAERNLAYQNECDELRAKMAMERNRIQMEKEALSERLGLQLSMLNQEKDKRENLLVSLLVEERKAREDDLYRKNLEKQIKEREQLRIELENYRYEVRMQKEMQFKEEEERIREEHTRYLAEQDKLDQLSDEKRRRKILEHSKALREMIEIRRLQRAKEIAERMADFENMLNREKDREEQIEMERSRMLSTVPKELLRYLPPGVLRPSDKEFLNLLE